MDQLLIPHSPVMVQNLHCKNNVNVNINVNDNVNVNVNDNLISSNKNNQLKLNPHCLLQTDLENSSFENTDDYDDYSEYDDYNEYEAPDYIIMEWELLNFIIHSTLMLYSDSKYVSFSRKKIEKEYEKLFIYDKICQYDNEFTDIYDNDTSFENNEYEPIIFSKKQTNFVKKYGKNGLYVLLAFRNGVTYNTDEKIWQIEIKPFLKSLIKEYNKDEDNYGFNFDKPWIKNF
jgi:hypothetical protein